MTELTAREREVVALLAQGLTPQMIADRLVVARCTIYGHLREAKRKTGAENMLTLAVKAAAEST